jgi:hypothetical protein
MDWRCVSSSTAPTLQVWSPGFKPHSHQKKKKIQEKTLCQQKHILKVAFAQVPVQSGYVRGLENGSVFQGLAGNISPTSHLILQWGSKHLRAQEGVRVGICMLCYISHLAYDLRSSSGRWGDSHTFFFSTRNWTRCHTCSASTLPLEPCPQSFML